MNKINTKEVLRLLGGKWPDSGDSEHWPSGFSYDSVDHFRIEDGELVPYDGGSPAPGPSFKLEII